MKQGERADYGIDAPSVIRNLAVSGVVCLLIALASPPLRWFFSPAVSLLATAAVWLYNSKFGKLRLREKLIDTLTWSGSETVLDVGCGSGLLLIAAAKRLTDGMAVGVDIWRQEDLMEIIRVLQPGGRFLIADFRNTGEYARVLREQGIGSAQRKRIGWVCLFPVFAAVGSKPLDK